MKQTMTFHMIHTHIYMNHGIHMRHNNSDEHNNSNNSEKCKCGCTAGQCRGKELQYH